MYSASLNDFLLANNIHQDTWLKSSLQWSLLEEIAKDYETQINYLTDSAEFFARVIQRFPSVHSVRWRIKSTDHLLEKIVRKKADNSNKYQDINKENYFEKITDLIGLRALHLFKDDCFLINEHLRKTWELSEKPIAYVREGDPREIMDKFISADLEVKEHSAGYRSIHYVCKTQPLSRVVYTEIQVRTIFEEGWSEIDHRVRYPNFSSNEHVDYFLTIFNRLAGSADEMGTFVQQLTLMVSESNKKITEANKARDQAFSDMHDMLRNLENMKEKDAEAKTKISALQKQLEKVQSMSPSFLDPFSGQPFKIGSRQPSQEIAALRGLSASMAAQQVVTQVSSVNPMGIQNSLSPYLAATAFHSDPNRQNKHWFGEDAKK